jgi:hypothetical protein
MRWAMAGGALFLVAGSLFLGRWALRAQTPAPPPNTEKIVYTNKTVFQLPVKIDDHTRAQLREVYLWVKNGTADWVQQESAPPDVQFFAYRVPHDGEYCFSIATVDHNGKMNPADIRLQRPGLRVVVDTQPPTVTVKPWVAPDGESCLHCELQDIHPDPQSIQITYRGKDQIERALEPHPFKAGLFYLHDLEILNGLVKVTAADRCGNRVTREIQLGSGTAAAPPAPLAVAAIPLNHDSPRAMPGPSPSVQTPMVANNGPAATNPPIQNNQAPLVPSAAQGKQAHSGDPAPAPEIHTAKASPGAFNPSIRQLLNTTRAALDYRIDQVGSSGVGKVEVYITPDNGQTWQRLCEDTDRHSPADIELPAEGLYGIRLAITNGNGFGGNPPARGDAPSSYIEVDTTAPHVQLGDVDPVTDGGTLAIHWKAYDKNLAAEPISLFYRARADGPWKAIARGLKNEGSYRWAFPHDVGSQFFLRIEAVDLAGNVAKAETPSPVVLDMTEPRGTVVGVTAITTQPR